MLSKKQNAKKTKRQRTRTGKRRAVTAKKAGANNREAAKKAGVSHRLFYKWKREDAEFAADIREAEEDAVIAVENALFDKALSGNVTAMIFFLVNRSSDRWSHVNKVHLQKDFDLTDKSDAELLAIIDEAKTRCTKEPS